MTMVSKQIVYFDMETLGKHEEPWKGKIISIQIRTSGETRIWKEWEIGEKSVINEFFDYLNSIRRKDTTFIGFGIRNKDIPFLNIRLRELGLFTKKRFKILNFWLNWVDFYHVLGGDYIKFRQVCDKLRLKSWRGKHASLLYQENKFDEVEKYIREEMKAMEKFHRVFRASPLYKELNANREQVSYDLERKLELQ